MHNIIIVPSVILMSSTSGGLNMHSMATGSSISQTIPSSVYVNGISHPMVNGNNGSYASIIYDPLSEQLSWYGLDSSNLNNCNKVDADILNKFWDMRELHDMISCNCQSMVFVQKSYQAWKLVFEQSDDFARFSNAWDTKRKNYGFMVDTIKYDESPTKILHDITLWCSDNIRGLYLITQSSTVFKIMIKNEADAAIFELRWMNA